MRSAWIGVGVLVAALVFLVGVITAGAAPQPPAVLNPSSLQEAQRSVGFTLQSPAMMADGFKLQGVRVFAKTPDNPDATVVAGYRNLDTNAAFELEQTSRKVLPGNHFVDITIQGRPAQLAEVVQPSGRTVRSLYWTSDSSTTLILTSVGMNKEDMLQIANAMKAVSR